ncbi:Pentatricopeptide repeat-containing protein [Platanthera guangdongensis]|uniref:Pentatricopeptide repeat-containing protein n=1 Tax=Platanthera guangdongensis TaxID=2320717 RepID=A0ABR2MNV5_9ASPA
MSRLHLISTTSKIVYLSRSGNLPAAQELFDEMRDRDTIAWNAMLAAYSRSGLPSRTLSLFSAMRASCTSPDPFSFTSVLAAAADLRYLRTGEKLHSLALRSGLTSNVPVSNTLVDMYGKCFRPSASKKVFEETAARNEVTWCALLHGLVTSGLLLEARKLFDNMPVRNLFACNIMLMAFASSDDPEITIDFFGEMFASGFQGDALTFTALFNACAELYDSSFGQMIHALTIRNGWFGAVEINNSLLSFSSKFDFHGDALKIFESMETRSQVSWNTMIDSRMKFGAMDEALKLFQNAPEINIVTWTSMIAGFARNGHGEEAIQYFVNLQRNSHLPDEFALGAVLHACAALTVLRNGLMVHGCAIRHGFEQFLYVANGLGNMYAKCGEIESCGEVFDGIEGKDLVSWNVMIFGFAAHGLAQKALKAYGNMVASRIYPDKLTFLGLLMACGHTGFIGEGMLILSAMESVHRVSPEADHVTCAVDMLARAGYLNQAANLADVFSGVRKHDCCEALLGGSAVHGDVSVGERAGEQLIGMDPEEEAGYVMLSNLYCFSGRWPEAETVRRAMAGKGVRKKTPGCSWIEVRDALMVFVSGVCSLHYTVDVHNMLLVLGYEMRNPSFIILPLEKD